jgi:hypothetical protein
MGLLFRVEPTIGGLAGTAAPDPNRSFQRPNPHVNLGGRARKFRAPKWLDALAFGSARLSLKSCIA